MDAFLVPLFFVAFGGLWLGVVHLIARIGGWHRLVRSYAGARPDGIEMRHFCGMRLIGKGLPGARYNGSMSIGVNGDGIYMRPFFPFSIGHAGVFLPFAEAHGEAVARMFGSGFEIVLERAPGIKIQMSARLGRWIEEMAMQQRG